MSQMTPFIHNLITFPNTTNPLYVRLGNPDLKMETQHLFFTEYTARIDSIDQQFRIQLEAKAKRNAHWQEKVRQTVQNVKRFIRTERGCYALAPAA